MAARTVHAPVVLSALRLRDPATVANETARVNTFATAKKAGPGMEGITLAPFQLLGLIAPRGDWRDKLERH